MWHFLVSGSLQRLRLAGQHRGFSRLDEKLLFLRISCKGSLAVIRPGVGP